MNFNRNSLTVLLCFSSYCSCIDLPFGKPFLEIIEESHMIVLPLNFELEITGFRLLENKTKDDSSEFLPIIWDIEVYLRENVIVFDLSDIDKDVDKQYKICVYFEQNREYFTPIFEWDEEEEDFMFVSL